MCFDTHARPVEAAEDSHRCNVYSRVLYYGKMHKADITICGNDWQPIWNETGIKLRKLLSYVDKMSLNLNKIAIAIKLQKCRF